MKLPNGKTTSNFDEFKEAWSKLITPLQKLLDVDFILVCPTGGLLVRDSDSSCEEKAIIPVWLVKKILKLRPPLQKLNPADEIYLHSIPVDLHGESN